MEYAKAFDKVDHALLIKKLSKYPPKDHKVDRVVPERPHSTSSGRGTADTIDHSTLLTKLDRYGIRGNANCLIKSYLSNRTQYTEVLNEKSENLIIRYGVPQGSVLGPLLFLLYINDIANSSDLGTFILFADDTNIFISGKTVEEAYKKGNKLLSCIKKYMILNKLHINMSKCCFVHFKPKASKPVESPDTLQLHIDGFPIKKTKATKFLGVVIVAGCRPILIYVLIAFELPSLTL